MTEQRLPRDTSLDSHVAAVGLDHVIVISIHRVEDISGSARNAEICVALTVELDAKTTGCTADTLSWCRRTGASWIAPIAKGRTFACLLAIDAFSKAPALSVLTAAFVIAREEWFPLLPVMRKVLL
jgi:hypothetical protein